MNEWNLGIDFGTSYTVAAVARGAEVSVVDIESNGRARIPSSVFVTIDDDILIGSAAQHQSVFAPERYEPTPKRSFGEGSIFLGDQMIAVVELAAAVLRRVFGEACRQQGETMPTVVRVTHPAEWAETRLAVLRAAIARAGLPDTTQLIAEPVAAAIRIARTAQPGQKLAVYDFGGGTFDAAVLVRTANSFELAGPPAGRDPLGGEDIDRRILDYIGSTLAADDPQQWQALIRPTDPRSRRDAATLRSEVQQAKETLSEVLACQVWIPGFEREIQLTRAELDQLIRDEVDETVATLAAVISAAGLTPMELSGIYLVGGSSRIPLVAETIWRQLQVKPSVQDNPKSVVAMGAATVGALSVETLSESPLVPSTDSTPTPASMQSAWSANLAFALEPDAWPAGCECATTIVVQTTGQTAGHNAMLEPTTLRVRDEPCSGTTTTSQLAATALAHRATTMPGFREVSRNEQATVFGNPGIEATFEMNDGSGTIQMFERYVVLDGRSYVAAGGVGARKIADSIELGVNRSTPQTYISRLATRTALDANITERATLRRRDDGSVVTVEQWSLQHEPTAAWTASLINHALSKPASQIVRVSEGRVLDVSGNVTTVAWQHNGEAMLTRCGIAVRDRMALRVQVSLRHADQALFAGVARHPRRFQSR